MKPVSYSTSSLRPEDDLLLLQPPKQTLRKGELVRESRIYLDSPDWRLREAGKWLYFRPGDPAEGLLCGGSQMEAQVATEVDQAPEFIWQAPAETGAWLKSTLKMRRLLPRLRLDLEIQLLRLEDSRQKTVAQVHLLEARARRPRSRRGRTLPARVVVVPLRGYDQPFRETLEQIDSSNLFSRTDESIYDEGMQQLDPTQPEASSEPILLTSDLSATQGVQSIFARLHQVIESNAACLADPQDSESVHQFRVAIRKTRSLLGRSRGIFPKRQVERFAKLFAWLGRSSGPARDLDVYLLKLNGYNSDWPDRFGEHLEELKNHLEQARAREQKRLISLLSSHRYRTGMAAWKEFLEQAPSPRMPDAEAPLQEFAAGTIWQRYRKIRKAGKRLQADSPARRFHRVRIQCKKLRYLLEFFAPLFDAKPVGKIVAETKEMQDILGDFNDCTVQAEWLEHLAEEFPGREHAELRQSLSLLSEDLRSRVDALKVDFAEQFRRFDRKKNRKRFRRLFKEPAC